jgi:hypothetical protein
VAGDKISRDISGQRKDEVNDQCKIINKSNFVMYKGHVMLLGQLKNGS